MQTKGFTDFFLPSKVAYHVKILIGALFVTMFFNMVWKGTLFASDFWFITGLMIIQLEIFMFIAFKIFPKDVNKVDEAHKRKVIIRLLIFYLIVLLIASSLLFLIISFNMFFGEATFSDVLQQFVSKELRPFILSWVIGIGIGSVIFFYLEWTNALKREKRLREKNLIFQYETLKNQVNPHFLFNSLNTLASLVAKDPELSERFISKFSSIYRYILENKDRETVSLSDEITFVNNFFYLQKIRDDGKIDLRVEVDNPDGYVILPISLQLLVENALKHNAATMENPLKINIALKENNVLVVENNLQKKMQIVPTSKIGLKNLRERISLVMKKELVVEEKGQKFVVKLPVKKIEDESTDHRR